MRGIKSENLLAIVDFLYYGEANVYQEHLDSFLAIAEELKLKGLMGQTECNKTDPTPFQMNTKPLLKMEKSNTNAEQIHKSLWPKWDKQQPNAQSNDERRISIPNFLSGDLQELDEKVKSLM